VTRYLLDTNVINHIISPEPSDRLIEWMTKQHDYNLFIASLTVAEIWQAILEMPKGKQRKALESWFPSPEGPNALFADRILPFDDNAGLVWARMMAEGTASGQPRGALDMMIAAIAEANDCVVVTDNEKDFASVQFINPMRSGGK
jgi:toxin FitB